MALGLAARAEVVSQTDPATVERLELGTLGGWLVAHGRWPAFEWDHAALAGRDWRVRTALRGRLYPTGHTVVFVTVTSRDNPDDAVAVLRQRRYLLVTAPVRDRPADPARARAFPFDTVEILDANPTGLDDPTSRTRPDRGCVTRARRCRRKGRWPRSMRCATSWPTSARSRPDRPRASPTMPATRRPPRPGGFSR